MRVLKILLICLFMTGCTSMNNKYNLESEVQEDTEIQENNNIIELSLKDQVILEISELGNIIYPIKKDESFYYEFPNLGFTMVLDYQFDEDIIVLERKIMPKDIAYYYIEFLAYNSNNNQIEIASYAQLEVNSKNQINECEAEEYGCGISILGDLGNDEFIVQGWRGTINESIAIIEAWERNLVGPETLTTEFINHVRFEK